MQPPPEDRNGGSRATGNRRHETNAAKTQALAVTVQPGSDTVSPSQQTALLGLFADNPLDIAARVMPRSRIAFADLWAPDAPAGRRGMWTMVFHCPLCHRHHVARAKSIESARGKRRAGCGRIVRIRIRRVYDARSAQAVSA
jgi:hypothetical protein